jgi:ATP-binding cassette subfamily B protein
MFVREPELLVFDDLSSALDVETERTLWERLFDDGEGGGRDNPAPTSDAPDALEGRSWHPTDRPTCLVVSHRRAALRRADQIVVLEGGQVADAGTLDELLERSDAFCELWYRQGDRDRGATGPRD